MIKKKDCLKNIESKNEVQLQAIIDQGEKH